MTKLFFTKWILSMNFMNIYSMDSMSDYLMHFIGTKYQYGGELPGPVDCGALIKEGLRSVGFIPNNIDMNSQMIYDWAINREGTHSIKTKDSLIFYGKSSSDISHIAMFINNYQVIEASGGNTFGMVRIRPYTYRDDIVGILRLKP
jgi:cell wall-associated NlpC family hydrolase